MNGGSTGLLLVDVQQDFLHRAGLEPDGDVFVAATLRLLEGARRDGTAVFHAITEIGADGSGRMPHWVARDVRQCVAGSVGAAAPPGLAAIAGEQVFVKPFFSAFGNPDLLPALQASGVEHLVIAGLYTHACIRTSAFDAYQAGLTVTLAVDALASTEPEHARISLDYMAERGVRLAKVEDVIGRFAAASPVYWEQRNPSDWNDILVCQPVDGPQQIEAAVKEAQRWQPAWASKPLAERRRQLQDWAAALESRREQFIALMVREIGKPRAAAAGEVDYALALLRHGISMEDGELAAGGPALRYRPLGLVAAITPWNNPLAIAVGKLAPALHFGNAVLWKPAQQAMATSALLLESLADAGLAGGVHLIRGGRASGQWLARLPDIAAVSFTGSIAAGQQLARLCAAALPAPKPLQAELGGNNAVLVMADADIGRAAVDIAEASFSFSGQRCTAPRRIIVEQGIKPAFEAALKAATEALKAGPPEQPATAIGPVISRQKQQQLLASVESAVSQGARLLCGGRIPPGLEAGCWILPTVLCDAPLDSPIVRDESFGPIAVVLGARDIDEALAICNDVEHGLVACLFSHDAGHQRRFADRALAGMLSFNQARPPFAASAPFSGWKASGLGPPEHGRWARDFFTRAQALYGDYESDLQGPLSSSSD